MATSGKSTHDLPKATYAPRPPRQAKPPFWMIAGFLVMVIGTWLPLAIAARSRVATSPWPRIQLMQDMYIQPKSRPQAASEIFADGRSMRLPIPGTVARGRLNDDDHFYRGYKSTPDGTPILQDGKAQFYDGYPEQVKVTRDLLKTGQARFTIYCAVCHGEAGEGDGQIHRRVTELLESGATGIAWVPPKNLHDQPVREQPNGKLYNTINVGIRSMPGYGTQVPPKDRWAIVAYLRALELSQSAPVSAVPADKLSQDEMNSRAPGRTNGPAAGERRFGESIVAAHADNVQPPADERIRLDQRVSKLFSASVVVGGAALLVCFVLSFMSNDGFKRFWFSYLAAFFFFLTIALGALIFVLLQHATKAGWSVTVRRTAENIAATIPVLAALSLPIVITVMSNKGGLYRWAVPGSGHAVEKHEAKGNAHAKADGAKEAAAKEGAAKDDAGESAGVAGGKQGAVAGAEGSEEHPRKNAGYLSPGFFVVRLIIYFTAWSLIALHYRRQSILQDQTGDAQISLRLQGLSYPLLVFLALSITFCAFDLLMSLDPHWYSTMWGFYIIAGCILSSFAAMIVLLNLLQRYGYLRGTVGREHYHDLGKYLFGFVFFWGYIAFSQYMLLWYANIPEETTYLARHGLTTAKNDPSGMNMNGWTALALVLLFGHVLIPFAGLLSRHVKRNNVTLFFWACWILVFHYVDMYWIVMPELRFGQKPAGPGFVGTLVDLTALVGIGGIFVWALVRVAARDNLRPTADPRLRQALAFQNI